MNSSRMVDLLLVRLTREDEKTKVIDLLMSELGMSREDAREKVDSSPNILSEGVEMEQGRILQDRMYPFVDLLPRHYDGNPPVPSAENGAAASADSPSVLNTDNITSQQEEQIFEDDESDETNDNQSSMNDDDITYNTFVEEEDDNSLIITSASEEMLNIERCHICGRTPTGGQKLAPCQICGDLTCSDCYNRKHHVCEKCATAGRAVDRPLDSVPESRQKTAAISTSTTSSAHGKKHKPAKTGKSFSISPFPIILTLLILVAAFFILDPMGLLSSSDDDIDSTVHISADTALTVQPDNTHVTHVPEADTTAALNDSLPSDSTVYIEYTSLRDVSLPDALEADDDYMLPRTLTYTSIRGLTVQSDSLPYIAEFLGKLASVYSIEFDGVSLVLTEDGYTLLLLSILHPEPAEKRTALLGYLGLMLDSTAVDQMVLYYRENQYYDPVMFTFTADSFSVLAGSNSPNILQRKQALLPETTELITGSILDWMTDLN